MTLSSSHTPYMRPPLFAVHDEEPPTALYITLGPQQTVKIGTCEHCVRRFGAC